MRCFARRQACHKGHSDVVAALLACRRVVRNAADVDRLEAALARSPAGAAADHEEVWRPLLRRERAWLQRRWAALLCARLASAGHVDGDAAAPRRSTHDGSDDAPTAAPEAAQPEPPQAAITDGAVAGDGGVEAAVDGVAVAGEACAEAAQRRRVLALVARMPHVMMDVVSLV